MQLIAPHKFVRDAAATQDGRVLRRYRRRWKVERLFAWLHNFRRTVIRWAFFSRSIDRYSEDSEAYSGRAEALWYTGRLQDAIRDYSRALESKPTNIMSFMCFERCVRRSLEPGDKLRDSRAKSRRTCQAVANKPYVLLAKAAAERVGSSSRAAHISAR